MMGGMVGAWPLSVWACARNSGARAVRVSWSAAAGEDWVIRLPLFYCAGGCFRAGWDSGGNAWPVKAAEFIRAMRPLGPTTKGSERAFQLPSSSGCQVLPSSRLMSEPLVPTVIQSLRLSDHWTAERKPWGGRLDGTIAHGPKTNLGGPGTNAALPGSTGFE